MQERDEWTGEKIRNIELSRTYFGGVDEAETLELLARLAASADESALELLRISSERDAMALRIHALEAELSQREPDLVPEGYTERALSRLIHDARQRFDELLEEANQEALKVKDAARVEAEQLAMGAHAELQRTQESVADLLADARSEAADLRATAAAEAEQLLEGARSDVERTRRSVAELHRLLVDTSNGLVEALESALSTMEKLETSFPSGVPGTMVADLWPSAATSVDERALQASNDEGDVT